MTPVFLAAASISALCLYWEESKAVGYWRNIAPSHSFTWRPGFWA